MLSFVEKASYGVGAFGKDIAITTVYLFLMYYLTDTVGLNPAFVGTLFLVARLWDAFNDPIMGMLVDNTRTKWGKFKPWIAAGTVLNSIALLLLFYQPAFLNDSTIYVYISITYILWGMTYTMMDIPFWSMVPVVAISQGDRAQIATILRFCASIPWLLMGTFGLQIIAKLSGSENASEQGRGFFLVTIALIIIYNIATIILLLVLKPKENTQKSQEKISLNKAFDLIRKNDQLVSFIWIILCLNGVVQLANAMSIYFFEYVAGNKNLYSVYSGVGGIAELSGIFLYPIVVKIFGSRRSFSMACIIPVVGWVILFFSSFTAPVPQLVVAITSFLYRFGTGLFLAGSIVMLSNIVDYSELKFGTRNESIIFSVQTLLVKSASAFSGWIVGLALSLSGYVANQAQSGTTITVIRYVMTLVPIIFGVVAYIVNKKYFKLHHESNDTDSELPVSN